MYALSQMFSWGSLVIRLQPQRMAMIVGEGSVFLFLLIVGAFFIRKSIAKETRLKEQQQNFLLSVTHELKSPLAAIKISLETLIKRDLTKEMQTSLLNNSLKDTERLDTLVENMLLATKIDNRSYTFPKEAVDFSELVSRSAERLQLHSCGTEQLIKTNIEKGVILNGDAFTLSSVVNNLIENAVKYSAPCAEVSVDLCQIGGKVVFTVSDKGSGISDEEKMYIFDKFYRIGDENTRKTKGTGLGLFIVKEVLQKHDAEIVVKDNVPHGTIFEVTF